ncbi:unnamed protein product [Lymnaea stagnalis]|uniref:Major facilitator superfamily (MFS) profile domain-containing protein n=1 Tax=Lymnaea stagnalis TaxID=6523 RepID=A0AAV2II83_LYMST
METKDGNQNGKKDNADKLATRDNGDKNQDTVTFRNTAYNSANNGGSPNSNPEQVVLSKYEKGVHDGSDMEAAIKKTISQTWHAPDGGYGWIIVVSGLIISLIVDGLTYTFGLFLGDFERAFNQPKSTIALASSLQVGIYLMIGPVVSVLTNRFGCRAIIIAGSLIAGLAFIVSSWSPNVTMLILTYGVFGGIGFGMMYLPSVVAVSVYFERKRALATGISVCGSGIGTFLLAPITEIILHEYNWSWALLILGAIILNGVVFGALVRPLDFRFSEKFYEEDNNKNSVKVIKGKEMEGRVGFPSNGDKGPELQPLITVTDEKEAEKLNHEKKKQRTDLLNVPGRGDQIFASTPDIGQLFWWGFFFKSGSRKNSTPSVTFHADDHQPRLRSNTFDASRNTPAPDTSDVLNRSQKSGLNKSHTSMASNRSQSHAPLGLAFVSLSDMQLNKIRDEVHAPVGRKDIHLSGTLAEPTWDIDLPGGGVPDGLVIQSIESLSLLLKIVYKKVTGIWACLPDSARDTIEEMLDISILKDRRYWFVLLGNFTCMLGFYVPFVYVPERALLLGIGDEQAAFLLSIIGITNTIGRVATGIVIHFSQINAALVTIVALCLCGLMTIVCPLCHSYGALAAVSAIFGLCVAAYISMCSILLCDLLGVSKLTNAFGFVILFRGIACVIGPPMAGAIIDSTGEFDQAFFVGGAMIVIGGLCHLMLYIPCIRNYKKLNLA